MPRGLVRVTAPVAFARQQLVPKLPDFLAANPEVRVQLEVSDRVASLSAEGFDLAIRHSFEAPETHVAWKLCSTYSVVVASRAYLRKRGTPKSPEILHAMTVCSIRVQQGSQRGHLSAKGRERDLILA